MLFGANQSPCLVAHKASHSQKETFVVLEGVGLDGHPLAIVILIRKYPASNQQNPQHSRSASRLAPLKYAERQRQQPNTAVGAPCRAPLCRVDTAQQPPAPHTLGMRLAQSSKSQAGQAALFPCRKWLAKGTRWYSQPAHLRVFEGALANEGDLVVLQ